MLLSGLSGTISEYQYAPTLLHVYLNARGIDSKIQTLMVARLCVTISLGTLYNSSFYAIFIMNSNKA